MEDLATPLANSSTLEPIMKNLSVVAALVACLAVSTAADATPKRPFPIAITTTSPTAFKDTGVIKFGNGTVQIDSASLWPKDLRSARREAGAEEVLDLRVCGDDGCVDLPRFRSLSEGRHERRVV